MVTIGTRGFLGIKLKGKISGKYNHFDSYYDNLGEKAVEFYFNNENILELGNNKEIIQEEPELFLYNGLYCEYAYVHNKDDDTLEIYRGFFNKEQFTDQRFESHDNKKYYVHLIFVVDKKLHTRKDVFQAFRVYERASYEDIEWDELKEPYPERWRINMCDACFKPIKINKKYCGKIKCKQIFVARGL